MTDLIVNSDDAARTSPTASSADSQPQGVQARPPYGLASAALPFLGSSDDGPAALQPCPARRALGLAGASWAEELRVRAEHMLLGDGERPRASGMAPVAPQATNALVLDLRDAVSALWKARADGIKASCAPNVPTGLVDEMDVLGWLTADALGGFGSPVGGDHGSPVGGEPCSPPTGEPCRASGCASCEGSFARHHVVRPLARSHDAASCVAAWSTRSVTPLRSETSVPDWRSVSR